LTRLFLVAPWRREVSKAGRGGDAIALA